MREDGGVAVLSAQCGAGIVRAHVAIGGCAEEGGEGEGKVGDVRGDRCLAEDGAGDRVEEDDVGCGGGGGEDVGEGGDGHRGGGGRRAEVPLVDAALCPCADAVASEAERADVVVGDGELLHGERAADGEGDAAEAVDGVERGDDAGVVAGPYRVGDGVECERGDGLAIRHDGRRGPVHDGKCKVTIT